SDTSRIINLSVRANAGVGVDALTVGTVIGGSGSKPLLIRVVGPTLNSRFGLPGVVPDPAIDILTNGNVVARNDNWNANLSSVFSSVGAFALSAASNDAALTLSLPSGGTGHSARADTQGNNGLVIVE